MDFAAQLRVLQAANGDPAKLAVATVDLAYPTLPEAERTALKDMLAAAAIPHWCDDTILAALLNIPLSESAAGLALLRGLNVIEAFPARGPAAVNVHEAARLAIRRQMAAEHEATFRALSGRATMCFGGDDSPSSRIEWLYHLLCADPDRGAVECEALDRKWTGEAHPEDRDALALALRELETTGMVRGRAQVEVSLCVAEARNSRGEAAQLESVARAALNLAQETGYASGEARADCLLGDSLQAQGKLVEARAVFGERLRISQALAASDPTDAGWQRDLAVAHGRLGDVLQAQGQLAEAQVAFEEILKIGRRLAGQDPANPGWQRSLAVAHGRVGGVFQALDKLPEAQAEFEEYLRISRRLTEQDSTHAGWQFDLAVAYGKVGDLSQARGKLVEAQAAFGEYLRSSLQLTERDPTNAFWQRELAAAQSKVGAMLQEQSDLPAARAAFGEYLRISQRLAEQDPTNADWQRELAVAQRCAGGVAKEQGKLLEAQAAFGENLRLCRLLAEQDPTNTIWQHELALAFWNVAGTERLLLRNSSARHHYGEAYRIYTSLVKAAQGVADWVKEQKVLEEELAGAPCPGPSAPAG